MQEQTQSKLRSPWAHLLIAILVSPITAYAVFWGSFYVIAELDEGWRPAWFGDTSNADILALNPDNSAQGFSAELVPISLTASYTTTHPGCTFLIPIERKDRIQERLTADLKLSWTTFEIKQLSDGQEEITLYFMDRTDDTHGSRYRASKDAVQLQSYRYISDRGGFVIILLAMFVTFATHVLVLGFLLIRAIYASRRHRVDVVPQGPTLR